MQIYLNQLCLLLRSKPSQNFQVKYENNFSVAKLPNVNLLVQPISIQELNLLK